jgi:hypothetical protein
MVMVPEGWPCKHQECRPGFFVFNDRLCFKDEYGSKGGSYNEAGEFFCGGDEVMVQPVEPIWEEFEE